MIEETISGDWLGYRLDAQAEVRQRYDFMRES